MKKLLNIFVVSFALVFSSNLFANKIGVIYDAGGKFDKSFNELAFKTAERVKNELGWTMVEFEASNNTQIEQGMRKVADRGATAGKRSSRRASATGGRRSSRTMEGALGATRKKT